MLLLIIVIMENIYILIEKRLLRLNVERYIMDNRDNKSTCLLRSGKFLLSLSYMISLSRLMQSDHFSIEILHIILYRIGLFYVMFAIKIK